MTDETVAQFMARRPLVWRGSEALADLAVRPRADGEGKAEGEGDGKLTKNQLKKLEKQRQIDAKKAAKAQEKGAKDAGVAEAPAPATEATPASS